MRESQRYSIDTDLNHWPQEEGEMSEKPEALLYDADYTLEAEGAGGFFNLATCQRCGAAVIFDGSHKLHNEWHALGTPNGKPVE